MASQEHLDILKQGVEVWNQWRKEHPDMQPDLSGAILGPATLDRANLEEANLRQANLNSVYLNEATLRRANLYGVDIRGAHLRGADLNAATLRGADFSAADLSGATLHGADLNRVTFSGTNLSEADLSEADLNRVIFRETTLRGTKLQGAHMLSTFFGNVNLREVKGLETVKHSGPSTIGIDTIIRSEGNISEIFLRGAGIPDLFITYARSLISSPIEYYTCFISYSSRDQAFAERLHADLQSRGVRCWFAPEDLKIGAKIRPSIDESIRLYDKLLLVLSAHSITSQWVEQEVETALEKERKGQRIVLFPIRLDKAVMEVEGGWPTLVRNTRNIGDFTRWKWHDAYQKALDRLLRDLKAEAQKAEEQ